MNITDFYDRAFKEAKAAKDQALKEAGDLGAESLMKAYVEALGFHAYINRLHIDLVTSPYMKAMAALDDWTGVPIDELLDLHKEGKTKEVMAKLEPHIERILNGCQSARDTIMKGQLAMNVYTKD
jgi:hypothetical protein